MIRTSSNSLKQIFVQIKRNYGMGNFLMRRPPDFGVYKIVAPGNVSKIQTVPEHISTPGYYQTGIPTNIPDQIDFKTDKEISEMKVSCTLAANILKEIGRQLKVGMTTDDVNRIVHDLIIENEAYPAPLNYRNFPKSVCTSVNNVACHGIPDDRALVDGDIINVDITVYKNNYFGDCSNTFLIGKVDQKGIDLVRATENCLFAAIELCRPGVPFAKIGQRIEELAYSQGFQVLPSFCGHGIGTYFHGPPDIYHCVNNYPGRMASGMTFTIEPVLGQGSREVNMLADEWTCITTDNSRTAQAEHTIAIREDGAEILTQATT